MVARNVLASAVNLDLGVSTAVPTGLDSDGAKWQGVIAPRKLGPLKHL